MGFLRSLFSGYSEDDDDEEESEETGKMPDLYEGMAVEVTTKSAEQMLSGRITSFTDTEMTIERRPGCLAFGVYSIGMPVLVKGYNRDMTPFSMAGSIRESSRICCKLKDLKAVAFTEQRLNFRLRLNVPVSLYYQEDVHYQNPEACTLVDISTGGACIESEFLHAEDEVLRLQVKLEDYKAMGFLGQIIRVEEYAPGHFRYGFLFAQLREDELTELTKILYNIQVGNKRVWSRSSSGHW